MTDAALARALVAVEALEGAVRPYVAERRRVEDLAEADSAVVALRHVVALRRALTDWITTRAMRAALAPPVVAGRT